MKQKGEYPRLYCYKKKMELGENQEEIGKLNQEVKLGNWIILL